MKPIFLTFIAVILWGCTPSPPSTMPWIMVDNFETQEAPAAWINIDAQNETDPFVPHAQVTQITPETDGPNHYLIKKPAKDGVVGNRKAISLRPLPQHIEVGETYTIYTRVNVQSFPNNHAFGLSNVEAAEVETLGYDAFEPMIRITDKAESDGTKNDGTLMVLSGYKAYEKIAGITPNSYAKPMQAGTWYELWYVINNAPETDGGQTYDLHIRGGEFEAQQRAYNGAQFRMKREAPLKFFMAICNTGPKKDPYGNGGVGYDDIYMAPGTMLSSPINAQ